MPLKEVTRNNLLVKKAIVKDLYQGWALKEKETLHGQLKFISWYNGSTIPLNPRMFIHWAKADRTIDVTAEECRAFFHSYSFQLNECIAAADYTQKHCGDKQ